MSEVSRKVAGHSVVESCQSGHGVPGHVPVLSCRMNANSSSNPSNNYLRDSAAFLRSWLKAPGRVGSVWPSSRFLARAATKSIFDYDSPTVVELGPGTGPMTDVIQKHMESTGKGRHIAVELNDDFVQRLGERFPKLDLVSESAVELPRILKERDLAHADVIISGLPFGAFPEQLQTDIMDAVVACLEPERGTFSSFNFVGSLWAPIGRRYHRMLKERFQDVSLGAPVILNVPPAQVITTHRPQL